MIRKALYENKRGKYDNRLVVVWLALVTVNRGGAVLK
jgi:hypothetical protein